MPHQTDKDSTPKDKATLTIRLTESAVFLRSDGSTRNQSPSENRYSVLRGLLILKLMKPTKISGIDIQLVGKSEMAWPEGAGARRVEFYEEHQFFRASTIYFDASKTHARRTASIGPGIGYAPEYDSNYDDWEELHPRLFHRHRHLHEREDGADSGHERTGLPNEQLPTGPPPYRRNVSVDVPHHQPRHVSYHEERAPVPPYSPPPTPLSSPWSGQGRSPIHTPSPLSREASPTRGWQDFRAAINRGQNTFFSTLLPSVITPPRSPSIQNYHSSHSDFFTSRQPSISHIPEHGTEHAETSRDILQDAHTSQQPSPPAGDRDRGRHKSRFTLSAVSNALRDVVRPSSPTIARPREGLGEDSGSVARGRPTAKVPIGDHENPGSSSHYQGDTSRSRRKPENLIEKVEEILKVEHKEGGRGWKEFKKGTYTYPISFQIPGDSPPTLLCNYGAATWQLRAHVHRPGTFRAKYAAEREVIIVSAPTEDDTEETENIIIERLWDQQLQYLIAVSGRSFHIGGMLPITFTILPIAKARVHRVAVYLEERVSYLTNPRKPARSDAVNRIELICIRNGSVGKHTATAPLLPLNSDDPEAFQKSPLYVPLLPQLRNEDEVSEMASAFMGPGPWSFHLDLKLPQSCSALRPTNKNKRAYIIVTHTLKVVLRTERGDDLYLDKHGKKKLFDIVIQTPVHILSCRCNPEWASLPMYAESTHQVGHVVRSCPCRVPAAPYLRNESLGTMTPPSHRHTTYTPQREPSRDSTGSDISTVDGQLVNPAQMTSLGQPRPVDVELANTFERLISGRESEMGEMPPAYRAI